MAYIHFFYHKVSQPIILRKQLYQNFFLYMLWFILTNIIHKSNTYIRKFKVIMFSKMLTTYKRRSFWSRLHQKWGIASVSFLNLNLHLQGINRKLFINRKRYIWGSVVVFARCSYKIGQVVESLTHPLLLYFSNF